MCHILRVPIMTSTSRLTAITAAMCAMICFGCNPRPTSPASLVVAGSFSAPKPSHPGPCRTIETADGSRRFYDPVGATPKAGEDETVQVVRREPGKRTRSGDDWAVVEHLDDAGRVLREVRHDKLSLPPTQREWTYDTEGRVTFYRKDEGDGVGWKVYKTYEYDDHGREVRKDYGFFSKPGPSRRWSTTYAADGRSAIRVRTRISDGREHSRERLAYDSRGLLTERRYFVRGLVPTLREQEVLTYDSAGRKLSYYAKRPNNPPILSRWRYDSGNNIVEESSDWGADGTINSRRVHEYACWER